MPLTPEQKTLRGQLAAAVTHSRHSGSTITENARKAFFQRFEDEVDPDRTLPPAERFRRAKHAHRAHMLRLSLKSSISRSKREVSQEPESDSAGQEPESDGASG